MKSILTAEMLEQANACNEEEDGSTGQLDRFREMFGDEIEVTPENFRAAHEAGLDVFWALDLIFDPLERMMLGADFAEHVLPIFEEARPGDMRVRDCITTIRRFIAGDATEDEFDAAARAARAAEAAAGAAADERKW